MRHDVEARAVAHRRRMQDRIAGRDRIDFSDVSEARLRKIAVREHRAFRAAGGAGGVKQPGEIVAVARRAGDRVGREQIFVFAAADHDHALERFRRMRRDLGIEPFGGKTNPRAGMLENVAKLRAMQLRIGRHGREARMPDGIERLEIIRAVLGGDGDAIAGIELQLRAQRARQAAKRAQPPRHNCAEPACRSRAPAARHGFSRHVRARGRDSCAIYRIPACAGHRCTSKAGISQLARAGGRVRRVTPPCSPA